VYVCMCVCVYVYVYVCMCALIVVLIAGNIEGMRALILHHPIKLFFSQLAIPVAIRLSGCMSV